MTITGYHWYRRIGGAMALIQTTTAPTWPDATVQVGPYYDYYVAAYNGAGDGPASNIVTVRIPPPGGAAMSERSTTFQGVQLGPEVTPGSGIPAGGASAMKRLLSMQLEPMPKPNIKPYRPFGAKGHTLTAKGKEYTENKMTGMLTYTDIVYLLSSILKRIAAPTGIGSLSQKWVFNPSEVVPETPQTYYVETGSVQGASSMPYGLMTDLTIKLTKDECGLDGTMIGQMLSDNITLTPAVAENPHVPVDPASMGVIVGTSPTNMTLLSKLIEAEFKMGGRWKPQMFLDPSNPSFTGITEAAPDFGGKITTEQNTDADALISSLRTGQLCYVGFQATGPLIEVGAALANPGTAPTATTLAGGGALAAGSLYVAYSYVTPSGETQVSPTVVQATTGGASAITATAPALPTGATGINVYAGTVAGTLTRVGSSSANVATFTTYTGTGAASPGANNATANIYYFIQLAWPAYFTNTNRGDHNDVWGNDFEFVLGHDLAFGLCLATVINKQAAL